MGAASTAIIYIRGVDLFSASVTSAAARAKSSIVSLQATSVAQAAKSADLAKKSAALTASIGTLEAQASAKMTAASNAEYLATMKAGSAKIAKKAGDLDSAYALSAQAKASANLSKALKVEAAELTASATANKNRSAAALKGSTIAGAKSATAAAAATELRSSSQLLRVRGELINTAGQLASVGLVSSVAVTLPLAMAGAAIVKTATDFEAQMRNIQSIAKSTDAENKKLGASFLTLSGDISKTIATPQQLADAFYEVQSAAFYGADAQAIIERSTKTATAGLADQVQTAKAVAMALHAYGRGAEEAGYFTDVMMRSVDVGVFKFEDLTTQMGDFIAAAGMMQMPIEQVFAALTTMTKKGLPIDEAATSLNRIFTSYLKPSDKAIAAAADFGIELSATHLKALGLAGAMNEVITKTNGSEEALAAMFPEMRSMRGVFALGSDGLKMFNDDVAILMNSAGTVDQVFSVQIKSWQSQIQNFKNQVSILGIELGEKLMPIILDLLNNSIKPLVEGFADASDGTQAMVVKVGILAAAFGPLMIVLSSTLQALQLIIGAIAAIKAAGLAGALGLGGAAAPTLGVIAGGVAAGKAMDAITNKNIEIVDETNLIMLAKMREELLSVTAGLDDAKRMAEELAGTQYEASALAMVDVEQQRVDALRGSIEEFMETTGYMDSATQGAALSMATLGGVIFAADKFSQDAESSMLGLANAIQVIKDVNFTDAATQLSWAYANSKWATEAEINKKLKEGGAKGPADFAKTQTGPLHGSIWSNLENEAMTAGEYATQVLNDIFAANEKAAKDSGAAWKNAADDSASKWKTAMADAADSIKSKLGQGTEFSIKLGDLTGGTEGGGPLAPGAGGPFEAIYRIQDIAIHGKAGATKGPDTDKWAQMYGLTPEAAAEIVKKFQMGIFDPQVMQYIDTNALIDQVKLEAAAKASQQALAEKLAADSGLAKDAFMSLLGMGKDDKGSVVVPNIDVGAIRVGVKAQTDALPKDAAIAQSLIGIDKDTAKTAADSTLGILLPAFDTSITDNAEIIAARGAAYWGKFEGGLIDAAKNSGVLYTAVEAMVLAALAKE